MNIAHLMASPFLGGPERQALGLARALPAGYRTTFLSFAEGGRCRPLLDRARADGFEAVELAENAPHFLRAARTVAGHLRRLRADVLCCSGYKPDLVGWRAARRVGVPVVAVAHGWTAATLKVRLNEALDRLVLRWFDAVVCVSAAQAARVRRAGVPERRIQVIRNAVNLPGRPDAGGRARALAFFQVPPAAVVGAAGRFSPEKGFDVLVEAAARVLRDRPDVGFLLCGDGPLRPALEAQIARHGLEGRVVLAGFRTDLDGLLPGWDLAVLASHTEGLPVFVLEALAAGVPVVATAVGGTPEVVDDGISGFLVPPADPAALAARIADALADDGRRRAMGRCGRRRVGDEFSFAAQAGAYGELFERLAGAPALAEVAGAPGG
jgi:glycosyltransferase involved in cell wall biosynthesis